MDISFEAMIAKADSEIESFSVARALAALSDADFLFVDLRDIRELQRNGKIPGAFHCPRGMLEFWVHPESPYHKPIFAESKSFIFYCESGWRSALGTQAIQALGLSPVAHIQGGFSAWRDAKCPVEMLA